MTLNPDLVARAREAEASLSEAERRVDAARTEYHARVRRLHLSGAPLREVAEALGMSHQRVQQIVARNGGSWWQRVWRNRNVAAQHTGCTFCGRSRGDVQKLIAGPEVFICDVCTARAEHAIAGGRPVADTTIGLSDFLAASRDSRVRCSFCDKRKTPALMMAVSDEGHVCGECLSLCRKILEDHAGIAPERAT